MYEGETAEEYRLHRDAARFDKRIKKIKIFFFDFFLKNRFFYDVIMHFRKFFDRQVEIITEIP